MGLDPRTPSTPFFDPAGTPGKFYGLFRALVRDIADPLKLGRVRLWVPALSTGGANDKNQWTNWAEPKFPYPGKDGASDQGSMSVPPVDSRVWCEFEMGDPDYPVYDGGYYRQGTPAPALARAADDGAHEDAFTVGGVAVPAESGGDSTYTNWHGIKFPGGVILEVDTEKNRLRLRTPRGASIEIMESGNVVVRAAPAGSFDAADVILAADGGDVKIAAQDVLVGAGGDIKLGDVTLTPLLDGVVTARGIDPFTGSTYGALGNASQVVTAKKV